MCLSHQRLRTLLAGLAVVGISTVASSVHAIPLHVQDFEAATPAPGTSDSGLFEFHGPASLVFTHEVAAAGGVGGSQGYTASWDGTASAADFFYFFGGGQFAVFADDANPLPSSNLADYTFSIDIKVTGNSVAAPMPLNVFQFNDNYDTENGVDGDGDGNVDGAVNFRTTLAPTLVDGGDYVTVSFSFDEGTLTADGSITPAFDPTVSLQWQFGGIGAGEFGFDAGNSLSIDNISIEVVPEPGAIALMGLGGIVMMVRRRK